MAENDEKTNRKGRDHHVGVFALLEDELCQWVPGDPSPNRLDAKVWAMTELSNSGEMEVTDNFLYN
jgi:phage terminase large subunit-like protein